jgi:hypothetical protein
VVLKKKNLFPLLWGKGAYVFFLFPCLVYFNTPGDDKNPSKDSTIVGISHENFSIFVPK